MEIEEYRKQFIDDIRNDASLEGSDPESYFIERVLTELEEIGELNDPIPMSVEIRNAKRQILSFLQFCIILFFIYKIIFMHNNVFLLIFLGFTTKY